MVAGWEVMTGNPVRGQELLGCEAERWWLSGEEQVVEG